MKKYDLIKMAGWIAVAIGGLVATNVPKHTEPTMSITHSRTGSIFFDNNFSFIFRIPP